MTSALNELIETITEKIVADVHDCLLTTNAKRKVRGHLISLSTAIEKEATPTTPTPATPATPDAT